MDRATGRAMDDGIGRLSGVIERLLTRTTPQGDPDQERHRFKLPHFDGEGDVELFISQYIEIHQANE